MRRSLLASMILSLPIAGYGLSSPALAHSTGGCAGLQPTIVVTGDSRHVVRGTAHRDVILVLDPGHVVDAARGDDVICGSEGKDLLRGGPGKDVIKGGAGDDRLFGGPGSDRLFGGPGDDVVHGNAGRDKLRGGEGDDRLFGDAGRDLLSGDKGDDTVKGGRGRDRIERGADDHVTSGAGDTVHRTKVDGDFTHSCDGDQGGTA
jgi:Ca2+-binding RTX toxin-like protein